MNAEQWREMKQEPGVEGSVYFAPCATRDLIKIGWVLRDFAARRHELNTYYPMYLDVGPAIGFLHGVPRKIEASIHSTLRKERVEGELFRKSPAVMRLFHFAMAEPSRAISWLCRNAARCGNAPPRPVNSALSARDQNGVVVTSLPHRGDTTVYLSASRWCLTLTNVMHDGVAVRVAHDAPPVALHVPAYVHEIAVEFTGSPEWRTLYDLAPWLTLDDVPSWDLEGFLRLSRSYCDPTRELIISPSNPPWHAPRQGTE